MRSKAQATARARSPTSSYAARAVGRLASKAQRPIGDRRGESLKPNVVIWQIASKPRVKPINRAVLTIGEETDE